MKRFKRNKGVGLHKCDTDNLKTNDIKTPDEPPEGSRWMKVPLGHVLSKSIHSCPMVKDKHLAAR